MATVAADCWCHHCSQRAVPDIGDEVCCPCCPLCNGGFVEEIENRGHQAWETQRPTVTEFTRIQSPVIQPSDGRRILSLGLARVLDGSEGAVGDYFMGPGLELVIERLPEDDPNRYGTPAMKSAVEAMPALKISEEHLGSECAVCTEGFEVGAEARRMPCQHMYHSECILPWLEQRNTCPVCRFQMPVEEEDPAKRSTSETMDTSVSDNPRENWHNREDGNADRRISFTIRWPLHSFMFYVQSRGGENGDGSQRQ